MNALIELAQHRHLIMSFARRDIRAKYKQTFFGAAWAIIQPASLMIVFTLVFSVFNRVESEGVPYPIFAYSALIFWTCFAASVTQGTIAMTANASLVRKIWFPRETLLFAIMISALIDLLVASVVLAGMFIWYGVPLHWTAFWVVPILLLQLLFTFAVVLVTSAAHVHFRDIGHAIPLMLQLWMFASPIVYPLASVPAWLKPYYMLNPMAGIIDSYRRVLLHGEAPDFGYLTAALLVALACVWLGYLLFKKAERTFADVI